MNTVSASRFQYPTLEGELMMPEWFKDLGTVALVGARIWSQIIGCRVFKFCNHVLNVLRKEKKMLEDTSPRSDIQSARSDVQPAPDEKFFFDADMGNPEDVYRQCQTDVKKLILVLQKEKITKEAAIQWVSQTYKLRSFVRKMFHGERAEVRVWQFVRVRRALAAAIKLDRLREEHNERVTQELRGLGL